MLDQCNCLGHVLLVGRVNKRFNDLLIEILQLNEVGLEVVLVDDSCADE